MGKFESIDRAFISRRTAFFEDCDLDPMFCVDNWPLLAGAVPTATFVARYEILKAIVAVPGHVLEFGVFNGANLLFMANLLSVLAPNDLRVLYGFDSWEGLSTFSAEDGHATAHAEAYRGDRALLDGVIELQGLDDRILLVDGDILQTLPVFLDEFPHHCYSLIYLDTDLYEPTRLVLERCWSRLSPGGVVVFDQGYHDRFPGEGAAFAEWAEGREDFEAHSFPFARQPMSWIRKR